ncbi:uncharacterized protein N7469_003484 [Penicillium citrinum]|uniref:Uncharacterized protein n=1 Tax=Penicillium citrinum TaxID=5077 RepID=A0A9W9P2M1_PENCI|nr:uncharacterized protein N7469_003484 [Penicillium citrinum]KAJ5234316.1 hypothetical protein N7469_003484 [Penicillium citrinum]
MHFTLLTLLAAGTSAQFVPSFVPQVAHAYGLEAEGHWHQISNQKPTSAPVPTPSTMISMASGKKNSIKPLASSMPYVSGMFAAPMSTHAYSHGLSHGYAAYQSTPSQQFSMATPTPSHRPIHSLHLHQAPPASHGPAVAPDTHVGVPAGGMGVPPSADAPALLNEAQEEAKNLPMGPQSNIAPVDNLAPLSPGNNVAPTHNHHKFGADKGNSFCLGQCFPSAEEAQCGPPYGSVQLQSEGCYTCCFSPQENW